MELSIIENFESRKIICLSFLKIGLNIIKKWAIVCIAITLVIYCFFIIYDAPKYFIVFLFFPCSPILFSFCLFISAPITLFPQQWHFYNNRIKCKGVRAYGTLKFKNITNWKFENISGMANHKQLIIKWEKWFGLQKGGFEIIIPPDVNIESISQLLNGKDEDKV